MKGIGKIVESRAGELIFSLFAGCAYFIVITGFVVANTQAGGVMLSMFFLPAIVCGTALFIIKTIRKMKEDEQYGKINAIIYAHIALAVISIAFLAEIIIK